MTTDATDELLQRARAAIVAGERSLREAAELIAEAQERGSTQRAIAAKVGKSVGWVNRLLAWRASGFLGDAFNRAARKTLHAPVQPAEQWKGEAGAAVEEQIRVDRIFADQQERVRAAQENADRIRFTLSGLYGIRRLSHVQAKDRDLLVKMLGRLGSDQSGEVLNAARMIETLRRKLDFQWDDLIIPAEESEQDLAA